MAAPRGQPPVCGKRSSLRVHPDPYRRRFLGRSSRFTFAAEVGPPCELRPDLVDGGREVVLKGAPVKASGKVHDRLARAVGATPVWGWQLDLPVSPEAGLDRRGGDWADSELGLERESADPVAPGVERFEHMAGHR